ncbi:DNA polymerase III subunit delta [Microlunatus sp. Gsoil 973]|jgi:DNA polymerase-3 subunit delta|uniref:DNA polymerase III subunit delta n=1 Tax=Microlunatus sp. Gsoil 973 TaxID=2672569 RepID=UPI0012B46E7F|nr:DNA polymerase III subunit delta [Microlunatus sp. Gsoil 973]QGN31756.1 DNA polymerase III subunit delta [Microlunatus sp. Gsoil 973]
MARAVKTYGHVVLISGPESLLADRAVAERLDAARSQDPDVEIAQVDGGELDPGTFAEITGGSLFSSHRMAVIRDLGSTPADVQTAILSVVDKPLDDVGLVLVHPGGVKGKALMDRLKKARVETIDCPTPKTWDLPKLVAAEAKRVGASMDSETAQAVVDAVGHDLRSLASAVAQLASDSDQREIPRTLVHRYFGGRAEVTSFAVADAALAGRAGQAMEQLRWALSTGVAPVLVTSALASGLRGLGKYVSAAGGGMRDADLAREIGVPPWKLKTMRSQARGWDERGLAHALRAVATADAEIKGAADDAEYALERVVLAVTQSRTR